MKKKSESSGGTFSRHRPGEYSKIFGTSPTLGSPGKFANFLTSEREERCMKNLLIRQIWEDPGTKVGVSRPRESACNESLEDSPGRGFLSLSKESNSFQVHESMKYTKLRYKDGRLIRDKCMRDGRRNGTYTSALCSSSFPRFPVTQGWRREEGEAPMLQHILASDASRTSSARRRGVERIAIGGFPCSKHASWDGSRVVYCCAADAVLPTGECSCRGVENDRGGRGREEGGEGHGENTAAEPM
ncbi:hypothetical protein B0H14DRAFT_3155781 [Mycena olivaceomarginata]|nr:hypothetical protein B0H14DRAFT_3155781 [Mycena olivaceomarginata]